MAEAEAACAASEARMLWLGLAGAILIAAGCAFSNANERYSPACELMFKDGGTVNCAGGAWAGADGG